MRLHLLGENGGSGYAVFGCMWKRGECSADTEYVCRILDAPQEGGAFHGDGEFHGRRDFHEWEISQGSCGREVPMQSRITAYWPDGSVKWTAHTADASLLGKEIEVLPGKPETFQGMECEETDTEILLRAGAVTVTVRKDGRHLFDTARRDGKTCLQDAEAVLILEEPFSYQGNPARQDKQYISSIEKVSVEEAGRLKTIIRYDGIHKSASGEEKFPFIVRMEICYNNANIKFTHTFLYDGDEDKDFLKGLGIRFTAPLSGELYNRHVKFTGDHGVFHETLVPLTAWHPRIPLSLYQRQMDGERLELASAQEREMAEQLLKDVPFWSEYVLYQDSVSHFGIKKKLRGDNLCYIDSLHGNRSMGGGAFGSEYGCVTMAVRDFWEKYPSGIELKGLDGDAARCTLWFWSPEAPAMDFRHYAERGYNQVCYEGYDYKGATPVGIACTNECTITFSSEMIPEDRELEAFTQAVNRSVVYVGTPEFYHEMRAFGYWSLPLPKAGQNCETCAGEAEEAACLDSFSYGEDTVRRQAPADGTGGEKVDREKPRRDNQSVPGRSGISETEKWLEEQLEQIFEFYREEVEQRNWYGMFNYGDVMHTYDAVRHKWKYDIGGYAWDNTELVPTLWLWLYFMRTGREDVYRMAEKLSRHASEVDVYHMGKYKGLGSRHNVRHWGCPCKEARIAMAGHHRYLYYLTGDRRLEDIFEELKDNELSFLNKDPLGDFFEKKDMVYPSHARSGPDWSALCSNWMTRWERFNDERYLEKIKTGIRDIQSAPLKLVSGPDFEFDPETCHLRYIGERTTGGCHLQICMGAPQIWTELGDLMGDEDWKGMLAELGKTYFMTKEERDAATGGLTGSREFTFPFMATGIGAYAAWYLKDEVLAERVWRELLRTIVQGEDYKGFAHTWVANAGNQENLKEIPWISTNFVAQFCLNVIMALEFIREQLPGTLGEVTALVGGGEERFHKA